MGKEQKKKNIKNANVILSVLLVISILALSTTNVYTHIKSSDDTAEDKRVETVIKLCNKNPNDNTPFEINNMFPGDRETKYYCVQVSYKDEITVNFNAKIRKGYEKLAKVMKCEIVLLTTGETLYDGLIKDMPNSLKHSLSSDEKTSDELYYKVTAYLENSVVNEYQNKNLIADFYWWVEEEENLIKPPQTGGNITETPQTGDYSNIILWSSIMAGSLFIIILLSQKARKEKNYEQYK